MPRSFRIGTRGSVLALYQAELAGKYLHDAFPSIQVEIVKITTTGDKNQNLDFSPLETKRVFTKEIEQALLAKEIDLAVHSAKDVAVDMPVGLCLGAVLPREDPRDCLVAAKGLTLKELAAGARIGTSSLRRKKQIARLRSDVKLLDIRGNVETRIRKMLEGEYEAIVLAHAALKRIHLTDHVTEIFDPDLFYPAPGQGVIMIQVREEDEELKSTLQKINHAETSVQLICERAFLKKLEGGCQLPCGIHTVLMPDKIQMKGALFAIQGTSVVEADLVADLAEPEKAGVQLAETILSRGGRDIIELIRKMDLES